MIRFYRVGLQYSVYQQVSPLSTQYTHLFNMFIETGVPGPLPDITGATVNKTDNFLP